VFIRFTKVLQPIAVGQRVFLQHIGIFSNSLGHFRLVLGVSVASGHRLGKSGLGHKREHNSTVKSSV